MPLGTYHIETGLLAIEGYDYALRVDGGGTWRLDVPSKAHKLVGLRVRVEGTRAGFDLLNVKKIDCV